MKIKNYHKLLKKKSEGHFSQSHNSHHKTPPIKPIITPEHLHHQTRNSTFKLNCSHPPPNTTIKTIKPPNTKHVRHCRSHHMQLMEILVQQQYATIATLLSPQRLTRSSLPQICNPNVIAHLHHHHICHRPSLPTPPPGHPNQSSPPTDLHRC